MLFSVYVLIRFCSGSLTLSRDETMIATNNTHNGFNIYSLPYGAPIGHFVEHDLHPTATSSFLNSDRLLVYPGGAGALNLWDIPSSSPFASVCGAGESCRATLLPLTLKHNPKITINRRFLQLRWDKSLWINSRKLGLTLYIGPLF